MNGHDDRWLADQLERHVDGQEAELPAGLARASGSLQQSARQTQPRAGFINQLAQQLQQEQEAVARKRAKQRSLVITARRLLGIAGVLAGLALIVLAAGYFSRPDLEPAITELETALPPLVRRAEDGLFNGVEFRLGEPLPDEPEQLPLYRARVAPLPDTVQEVRDLALALGLDNPQIYQISSRQEGWVAQDAAGRRLRIERASGRFPIVYRTPDGAPAGDEILSWPDAAARAIAFLQQGDLLPAAYDVREGLSDPEESLTHVEIIPTLDGRPVHYASSQVVVRADGTIAAARIQTLAYTPAGEALTAQPAREAFEEVLQSGAAIDAISASPVETYYPSLVEAAAGDEVRLAGFVTVLQPVDSAEARVELSQEPDGLAPFRLVGPLAAELIDESLVEVTGTLLAQETTGGWALEVSSWEAPPIDGQVVDCRRGILSREGQQMILLTDERLPFVLAHPPLPLAGQHVDVCAIFRYSPQPLPWLSITTPPASANTRFGNIGGIAGEEVQEVEVTRVIVHEEEAAGAVGFVTEQIVDAAGTVVTHTQAIDLTTLESPFEIGQKVEVSGVVRGYLQHEADRVVPHIFLGVDTDNDPTTRPVSYPLVGPWGLLLEISRHYQLQVTIPATIVKAQEEAAGPGGQAIAVGESGWRRTWPDEAVEAFVGHFEIATLEGREVRIFVDEATGERYVDAVPLYDARPGEPLMGNQAHADDTVWVAGVVNPDPAATFGGYPILTILRQQSAAGEVAGSGELALAAEMPLRTSAPPPTPGGGSRTLLIERAVLGYTYHEGPADEAESQTLQPTWLFYGQSADGRTDFVLRAPVPD